MSGPTTTTTTKAERRCMCCNRKLEPKYHHSWEATGLYREPRACRMPGCRCRTFVQEKDGHYHCTKCGSRHAPEPVMRRKTRLLKQTPRFFCDMYCAAKYGRKAAAAGFVP